MKELSDVELYQRIKASSYPAFTELYQRYWKYIYVIAYKKVGDRDDAFDLTQNVFMDFYEHRERLAINIPIKNYLRTAIIFKLSNYFRSKGFRAVHYRNFQHFLENTQSDGASFDHLELKESEMAFEEMVELIYQAIEDMPEKMKEIFLMSRSDRHSISAIADSLGLSPQTVKNQISKAYARIRAVAAQHNLSSAQLLLLLWLTQR